MPEQTDNLIKKLKKLVVNDYFTPNIKAEVILDTLLTPYIAQMLKSQLGIDSRLLSKEMSITDINGNDNRGAKIDYVLEGSNTVYLVELKTTKGSINSDQAKRYTENCFTDGKSKTFGQVLGDRLLKIMGDTFKVKDKDKPQWAAESLHGAFRNVTEVAAGEDCAERAAHYLISKGLASTHKYLYTVGQILKHHPKEEGILKLWKKDLKLVYLTPDGGNVFPNRPRRKDKQKQAEAEKSWEELRQKWDKLYLGPKGLQSSISLKQAVRELQPKPGDEEFVELLQSIINEIYPE